MILPIIKNVCPEMLAKDICSVQPMTEEVGQAFTLKYDYSNEIEKPEEGDERHVFSRGWERFYNGEWISEATWLKLKIKGL